MLAEFYYETYYGCYPFETSYEIDTTRKTANYLQEAGFTNIEIIHIWEQIGKHKMITPDLLPESLWDNSLLNKGAFYYHNNLQLQSSPVIMNEDGTIERQPFKLEMKIKYSINDLLDYFYIKTGYCSGLYDRDKDIGAMNYLLRKYDKLGFIEAVDFILGMIDYAVSCGDDLEFKDILTLNNQYAAEAMSIIKHKVLISKNNGYGKIIWR